MEEIMEEEIMICSDCGEEITNEDYYTLNNGDIICWDCYENNGYFTCDDCGEVFSTEEAHFTTADGDVICQDCYDNDYFTCTDCGEIYHNDDSTYIEDRDEDICCNCRDNGDYFCCEDCGSWYSTDDNYVYIENYGNVCESCYGSGEYGCCEDCGNYFCGDDLNYNEADDCYYCDECMGDHIHEEAPNGLVYGYHEFNSWKLFNGKNETEAPYYIGKEIELEPKSNENLHEVIDTMNKYLNAVGMRDGSLCYGGVEIVTHPESWKYLQENKEKYKQFFKKIEELKYGDNGGTGLHFHITRPNDDVISRLIVILESFKDEIKKLSRRNGHFNWSKFITDNGRTEMENIKYKSTKYIKDDYIKYNRQDDRYVALNLNNSKTIEFRFFNGANNFEEYWGALQFIHNLMEVARNESRDINTISWKELIKGKELEAQAIKQNVSNIDKYVKDTTSILEKLEQAQIKTKDDIKHTLKNFIKYLTKELEDKKLQLINKNDINIIEMNISTYMETLSNDIRYLQRLTSVYRNVDCNSIDNTKTDIDYIKNHYTRNLKGYARYFKQIEKTIKDFESEVLN